MIMTMNGTMTVLMIVMCIIALPALSPAIDLPMTGQTISYVGGDDGDIRAGVVWPSPRFRDNGNGTVTDNLTGLMWTQDGNAPGPAACSPGTSKTWQEALNYVACLNTNYYAGYNDWRLPNVNELESLVHAGQVNTATWLNGQGFSNVQSYYYWSATTNAFFTLLAWDVAMWDGYVDPGHKTAYAFYVLPVRGETAQLWKTGQTTSYATGDDGDLEMGVAWPSPRFTDNGNGTVTDNLTSLIWLKNADCFGAQSWVNALNYANTLNSGECGLTDGSVERDWRLPNRKELRSLVDYSKYGPPLLSGHPFTNMQTDGYWSSSTYTVYTDSAWDVRMGDGDEDAVVKTVSYYVWPVRGGIVSVRADLNRDGKVDSLDLGILLSQWGIGSGKSADFDLDGDVDSSDLQILLGAWTL